MTIHVSKDVENAIDAAVRSGRFASPAEMIAALVRAYSESHPATRAAESADPGAVANLGSIGALRDSADELDEIVADTYRQRRKESWRDLDL